MTPKRFTLQLALAGLVAVPLSLQAAGLGRLTVNSSLGQPLSAEIEIYADKAELDSLRALLASDDAYRSAGIGKASVLSTLNFKIGERGGKPVLKVTSPRAVNDPFVDMLIELQWASGKLVREYTLLIDPPGYRTAQQAAPVPASTGSASRTKAPKPTESEAPDSVTVRPGDTLGSIGQRVQPDGVSLDQTLISLFRANPKSFEGGNMNRLKAGSKLNVPDKASMLATAPAAARREVQLQSDDWRAYRARLADAVTASRPAPAPAEETAKSGAVAPRVVDAAKPAPEAKEDVLSLSKAPLPEGSEATAAPEDQTADVIARDKALEESSQRIALLEKQIADMQALIQKKEQAALAAQQAAATETGRWYDPILANPLYWGLGGGALVLGGALWLMLAGGRRRQQPAAVFEDSVMRGGNVPPVTVAPSDAGGGNVDTGNTSAFLTDFSQTGLGAIDTHDVDPIAEADVYIAYGRDAQAEDILKDALGKYPERHELRLKLLEIYAARRNAEDFEATAGALRAALGEPPGPVWDQAVKMGRELDPNNPLYGGGGSPAESAMGAAAGVAAMGGAAGAGGIFDTLAPEPAPVEAPLAPSFELPPLDLGTGDAGAVAGEKPTLDTGEGGEAQESKFDFSGLDLDLGGDAPEADEVSTKLDLARAYVEMGDKDGAREILTEVLNEGSDAQKADAKTLLDSLG